MNKMPLVIAFVCGVLAFLPINKGMMPSMSGQSESSLPEGKIEIEQQLPEQASDGTSAAEIKSIKNNSMQVLSDTGYEWYIQCRVPVTKIIEAYHGQPQNWDNWDHSIYAFRNGNQNSLMVICHGDHEGNRYKVVIGDRLRDDYVQAVEEWLAYWARTGSLKNVAFDQVVLTTCFSGYAMQNNSMPIFGIDLDMINNNKYPNGFREDIENGQMYVSIIFGVPKSMKNSVAEISDKKQATSEQLKNMIVLGGFGGNASNE